MTQTESAIDAETLDQAVIEPAPASNPEDPDVWFDTTARLIRPELPTESRDQALATLRAVFEASHWLQASHICNALSVDGKALIEVGCGDCWHAPLLLARGAASYCGLDEYLDTTTTRILDRTSTAQVSKIAYTDAPMSLGDFLACFSDITTVASDIEAAPLVTDSFDCAFMITVSEHLMRPAEAYARIAELLRVGGQLYVAHANYYGWNGHHLQPRSIDEYDETVYEQRAVVDWGHVVERVTAVQIDTLNFIRIHELADILQRHFQIDRWELVPSPPERGGGRLTPAIRQRLAGYYEEELTTEFVNFFCTKAPPITRAIIHHFVHDTGYCFLAELTGEATVLLEDGRRLGPADSLHDEIRNAGGGRYSIWHGVLFFSSSDNSDPRTNGRTYWLADRE